MPTLDKSKRLGWRAVRMLKDKPLPAASEPKPQILDAVRMAAARYGAKSVKILTQPTSDGARIAITIVRYTTHMRLPWTWTVPDSQLVEVGASVLVLLADLERAEKRSAA